MDSEGRVGAEGAVLWRWALSTRAIYRALPVVVVQWMSGRSTKQGAAAE